MTGNTASAISRHPAGVRRYRSIFISDIHLGSKSCKAGSLLDFLRHVESEYLYLVGDIIDGWRLKKKWFWPDSHGEILRTLLARATRGTRVVYLPGNHDEALRRLIGQSFAGVEVAHDVIHETMDGRRLLVTHGDVFDSVVRDVRWLARLGSVAYELSLSLNTACNVIRRLLGYGYWSLSGYLKDRVKAAVKFIDDYEQSLAAEASRRKVSGVVCGHVHKPEMRTVGGVLYVNDGDLVENCSALVEHPDGRLELVSWATRQGMGALPSPAPLPQAGQKKTALAA